MNILVIDTSVIAHTLGYNLESVFQRDENQGLQALYLQLLWVESAGWWDVEIDLVIWAMDVKGPNGYWRHTYLEERGIKYKGQRSPRKGAVAASLGLVPKILSNIGSNILGVKGFEADDIAAFLVKTKNPGDNLYLLTVDTDWSGLIGPGVFWTTPNSYHKPVHRWDLETLNEWCARRLNTTLEYPSQIWEVKAKKGDPSDNLPPGSPIEVIDLLNPPKIYSLWDYPQIATILDKMIAECKPEEKQDGASSNDEKTKKGVEACRQLIEAGIFPIMYPRLI